jgi:hypothetical protein
MKMVTCIRLILLMLLSSVVALVVAQDALAVWGGVGYSDNYCYPLPSGFEEWSTGSTIEYYSGCGMVNEPSPVERTLAPIALAHLCSQGLCNPNVLVTGIPIPGIQDTTVPRFDEGLMKTYFTDYLNPANNPLQITSQPLPPDTLLNQYLGVNSGDAVQLFDQQFPKIMASMR